MTSGLPSRTLTVILAGGRGERLHPLTRERAKPAVPFGGDHRIIDFTLSNCLNSNLRRIYLLTQSLDEKRWPMRSPARSGFSTPSAFIYPGFSRATNSIVSPGTVICGSEVSHSVLSPGVSLAPSSQVQDSVLMHGARVGRGARIRRAIVEEGANIPDGTEVGYDVDHDRRRFLVTEGGVVVVPASL